MAMYQPCSTLAACLDGLAVWGWFGTEEFLWNYATNRPYPGNDNRCGHFWNMMGNDVISIGCGYSTCANSPVIWCNYENVGTPRLQGLTTPQMAKLKKTVAPTMLQVSNGAPCSRSYCGPVYGRKS